MSSINPAIRLAQVQAALDANQQLISFLELMYQEAILGGARDHDDPNRPVLTIGDLIGTNENNSIVELMESQDPFGAIFGQSLSFMLAEQFGNGQVQGNQLTFDSNAEVDQQMILQLLGVARARQGELRIEEQAYIQELQNEQQAVKALKDLANG